MKRNRIDIKKVILKKIELRNNSVAFINVKGQKKMDDLDEIRMRNRVIIPNNESQIRLEMRTSQQENTTKYFSVVIPTMWRSDKILRMLPIYENSKYVKEIIIIDNDPTKTIDLSEYEKVRYYTKGKNIFVNPSWNLGFSLSNHNLILVNDDIIINDFDDVMRLISSTNYDIVGFSLTKDSRGRRIETIREFPKMGYGYFMYIKKYQYIPDQLKIWYGDKILFDVSKKRGILINANAVFDKGKTINSDKEYLRNIIAQGDVKIYESLIKPSNKLNIIIRTSGRPAFFKKCIGSIRKFCPDAKLHITIDDVNDLKYVKKTVLKLDYCHYLIDRDVISNICEKIPIEKNPFIYNYYFNVLKPFLNGWCLFLDDDDELLVKPEFNENYITNIYLHKIDISIKVVPSTNNFGKIPIINDISGLGIIFHSSQMVDWKPQRTGDYSFISEMYENCNPVWVDKILSKTQIGGNLGKRNDLIDKI